MTSLQRLLQHSEPLLRQFINHAFLRQAYEGCLRKDIFDRYLEADLHFLAHSAAVLPSMIKQLNYPQHQAAMREVETMLGRAEPNLRRKYRTQFTFFSPLFKIPSVVEGYNQHIHTCSRKPIAVAVASITPCCWAYLMAGRSFPASSLPDNHFFKEFIKSLSTPHFQATTEKLLQLLEELITANPMSWHEVMHSFNTSLQYELQFLNSIYYQSDENLTSSLEISLNK